MGDSPNESEEEDEEEDEDEETVKVVSNVEPSSNILEQQVPSELPLENNAGFGRSEVESMDVGGVSATSIADTSSESPLVPLEGQETTPKKSAKKKVRKEVLYEEIDVSLTSNLPLLC